MQRPMLDTSLVTHAVVLPGKEVGIIYASDALVHVVLVYDELLSLFVKQEW